MKRRNRIATLIMCVAAIILCGCGKNTPTTEFSSDNWLSIEPKQRYHMLEDLYIEVELVGMSSDEVEELLGTYSISHGPYLSDEGRYDYHWGYTIRYDQWEGYEYLLINFKDDIVVDYELEYGSEL